MALDLSSVFKVKNNVKASLLSDFVTMKLIGLDKSDNSFEKKVLLEVSTNFYHRKPAPFKAEKIFFVSGSQEEWDAADECTDIELVRADGTFKRYAFNKGEKSAPMPPGYEWEFTVRSNNQSRESIS